MLDIGVEFTYLGIGRSFGGVVNRDAVVGHTDLAIQEGFVVIGIKPRQGAWDHVTVKLFRIFQRFDGFWTIDHDLVVFVD